MGPSVAIKPSQLSTKLKLKLKLSLAIKIIKERAFGKLEKDKSNHSKVMNMKYKELKMQSYFLLVLPPEGTRYMCRCSFLVCLI